MAIIAGGKKTVAAGGTPEQLVPGTVSNQKGRYITITALPGNTNKVYIGNKSLVKATLVGCMGIIGATSPPFQIFTDGPSLNPEDIWLDVDTNGEGVVWGFAD
jgi:hypothetical protein